MRFDRSLKSLCVLGEEVNTFDLRFKRRKDHTYLPR